MNEEDTMSDEDENFEIAVMCVMQAVKEHGARDIWVQLKHAYPAQYRELLFYALEMLPK